MTSIGFLVYDITLMGGAERVAISLANAMIGQKRISLAFRLIPVSISID